MGTLTKTRGIKSITLQFDSSSVEIQWSVRVKEDGDVIGERFHRKAYSSDQSSELEADTSTAMKNRIATVLGWT